MRDCLRGTAEKAVYCIADRRPGGPDREQCRRRFAMTISRTIPIIKHEGFAHEKARKLRGATTGGSWGRGRRYCGCDRRNRQLAIRSGTFIAARLWEPRRCRRRRKAGGTWGAGGMGTGDERSATRESTGGIPISVIQRCSQRIRQSDIKETIPRISSDR